MVRGQTEARQGRGPISYPTGQSFESEILAGSHIYFLELGEDACRNNMQIFLREPRPDSQKKSVFWTFQKNACRVKLA
jgi:hypothetical protein